MGEHRRCLFLDMGKVLIDFDLKKFAVRMQVLAAAGPEQLRAALMDDGLVPRFESGAVTEEDFCEEVCRRLKCRISQEDLASAWNSIFMPDPVIAEEVIATLARRLPLWAISNTNPIHFRHIRERFAFLRHFRGFVLSYEVGAPKPDRRIFLAALDRAGAEPGEAVFVDDQEIHVEAAAAMGIDAFRFLNPYHFLAELQLRGIID